MKTSIKDATTVGWLWLAVWAHDQDPEVSLDAY